jgi:hypothetical protein
MDFNWGKKFTELQKKQNRLGTQRAVISRSFIDHAIRQAVSTEHNLLLDEVMEWAKSNQQKFDGAVTIDGLIDANDLLSTLSKMKEE